VVRTAAREAPGRAIADEIRFLTAKWEKIRADYAAHEGIGLIYNEGDLVFRGIRDILSDDVESIIVNSRETAASITGQLKQSGQDARYASRIEYYGDKADMFTRYGIWTQVDKLLYRRVELKNGAYLVIDRAEAMTVIDVNTGSFTGDSVGGTNMEETAFLTNMSAAEEIARQLRLRNTGGIIIIDFIDMHVNEHNEQVVDHLKNCLKADRTRCNVVGMTPLGLVEMTRKKTAGELSGVISEPCQYCGGEGRLYSARYLIGRMRIALQKLFDELNPSAVIMTVSDVVTDAIFRSKLLSYHCENSWAGKRIYVVPDKLMHRHNFRLRGFKSSVLELPDTARLLY
jgi:ribonuclease G